MTNPELTPDTLWWATLQHLVSDSGIPDRDSPLRAPYLTWLDHTKAVFQRTVEGRDLSKPGESEAVAREAIGSLDGDADAAAVVALAKAEYRGRVYGDWEHR